MGSRVVAVDSFSLDDYTAAAATLTFRNGYAPQGAVAIMCFVGVSAPVGTPAGWTAISATIGTAQCFARTITNSTTNSFALGSNAFGSFVHGTIVGAILVGTTLSRVTPADAESASGLASGSVPFAGAGEDLIQFISGTDTTSPQTPFAAVPGGASTTDPVFTPTRYTTIGEAPSSGGPTAFQAWPAGLIRFIIRAALNPAVPYAPRLTSPKPGQAIDATTPLTITWVHRSPQGATQADYLLRRRVIGTTNYQWWTGSAWSNTPTAVATASSTLALGGAFTPGSTYLISVATIDTNGQSSYSDERRIVAGNAPAISGASPSGSISDLSLLRQPTWTNSDADGDAIVKWYVAIVPGNGGFDVTNVPQGVDLSTWSDTVSGGQPVATQARGSGPAMTYPVPSREIAQGIFGSIFPNGTYSVRIATQDATGLIGSVTVLVTPNGTRVPTPSIGVVDSGRGYVSIGCAAITTPDGQPYQLFVQRSTDGGTTWTHCCASDATPSGSTATTYDFTVPINKAVQYRAIAGQPTNWSNAWSTPFVLTPPARTTSWWISSLPNYTRAQRPLGTPDQFAVAVHENFANGAEDVTIDRDLPTETSLALGAAQPVVIGEAGGGSTRTVQLVWAEPSDARAKVLHSIATSGQALLIQGRRAELWIVKVTKESTTWITGSNGDGRRHRLVTWDCTIIGDDPTVPVGVQVVT